MTKDIDILENEIDGEILSLLLKDNSSCKNIIWATDDYSSFGNGYLSSDEITVEKITGRKGTIIRPRSEKSLTEQQTRIKDKAEVFTPAWVCNKQNNLIDEQWFERKNVFNIETADGWKTVHEKISFPTRDGKTWQDYVKNLRLEITCGEAPYLTSRYNTINGRAISLHDRIGLLDRKLRVISENVDDEQKWYEWALRGLKSVYGFDWQGDNVLLARENLLYSFRDFYFDKFGKYPERHQEHEIATVLAWNIWQMDGLKFVIPNSCVKKTPDQFSMFDGEEDMTEDCPGCRNHNPYAHTGVYCKIKDWNTGKAIKFVNLIKEEQNNEAR